MNLTPKGEKRRNALLDAALRVLEREGAAAITHRSVAAEAGLPAASATYYFASLDELYVSALRRATREQVALLAGVGEHDARGFARVLREWAFEKRAASVAQYELMFQAMRRESLRPEAEAWYAALAHAIDPEQLHPTRTRVTALAIDGLLLRMVWLGHPSTTHDIEAAVREITSAISA